tara:strand:- start:114 stop:806 length:693 start_codon:yes stop_codon:yes gene_type:complete
MNKASDYVNTIYSEKNKPFTDYPKKLAKYLFNRYNIKKNARLLEFGCGRGEFLNEFIELGVDGYGIDISNYSKTKFPKINLSIQDLDQNTKTSYADNYFDVIFSKSFVEHFYDPQKIFEEMKRILKPGGILITLTPCWEDNYKMFFDDYTHKRPFTTQTLINIQNVSNLRDIEVERFKQLPITWIENTLLKNFFILLTEITRLITPVFLKKKFKWVRFSKETMLLSSSKK